MILLHGLPVKDDPKFTDDVEQGITEEDDEVEILGSERTTIIVFEYLVADVQLIGIFAVELEEDKEKYDSSEKPADVRQSLI